MVSEAAEKWFLERCDTVGVPTQCEAFDAGYDAATAEGRERIAELEAKLETLAATWEAAAANDNQPYTGCKHCVEACARELRALAAEGAPSVASTYRAGDKVEISYAGPVNGVYEVADVGSVSPVAAGAELDKLADEFLSEFMDRVRPIIASELAAARAAALEEMSQHYPELDNNGSLDPFKCRCGWTGTWPDGATAEIQWANHIRALRGVTPGQTKP